MATEAQAVETHMALPSPCVPAEATAPFASSSFPASATVATHPASVVVAATGVSEWKLSVAAEQDQHPGNAPASGEPSPLIFVAEVIEEDVEEEKKMSLGAWKKNCWSKEEDRILNELIIECGTKVRWSVIGEKMAGRSGKQCRERWHNHLSPDVNKNKWSAEEDRAIVEAVQTYGTRWSEIVKMFPGRTDNAIKNRWNSMQRKENRRVKRMHENSQFAVAAAQAAAAVATGGGPTAAALPPPAAPPPPGGGEELEAVSVVSAVAVAEPSSMGAEPPPAQRRRLVQATDLIPAAGMREATTAEQVGATAGAPAAGFAPMATATAVTIDASNAPAAAAAPTATAHYLPPALAQQVQATGVQPPLVLKPGGRRKRAVQARSDIDAASLVLGLCGTGAPAAAPPPPAVHPAVASLQQHSSQHPSLHAPPAHPPQAFSSPALSCRPLGATSAAVAATSLARTASGTPPVMAAADLAHVQLPSGPATATLARAVRATPCQPTPTSFAAPLGTPQPMPHAMPQPMTHVTPHPIGAPPPPQFGLDGAQPVAMASAPAAAVIAPTPSSSVRTEVAGCSFEGRPPLEAAPSGADACLQPSLPKPSPPSFGGEGRGGVGSPGQARDASSSQQMDAAFSASGRRRVGGAFDDAGSMEAATLLAGFAGF